MQTSTAYKTRCRIDLTTSSSTLSTIQAIQLAFIIAPTTHLPPVFVIGTCHWYLAPVSVTRICRPRVCHRYLSLVYITIIYNGGGVAQYISLVFAGLYFLTSICISSSFTCTCYQYISLVSVTSMCHGYLSLIYVTVTILEPAFTSREVIGISSYSGSCPNKMNTCMFVITNKILVQLYISHVWANI